MVQYKISSYRRTICVQTKLAARSFKAESNNNTLKFPNIASSNVHKFPYKITWQNFSLQGPPHEFNYT
jgi:hypothetical protein